MSPAEALDKLLANSGLTYRFVNDRTVRIAKAGDLTEQSGELQDERTTVGTRRASAPFNSGSKAARATKRWRPGRKIRRAAQGAQRPSN